MIFTSLYDSLSALYSDLVVVMLVLLSWCIVGHGKGVKNLGYPNGIQLLPQVQLQ
jgi:hypothetical protein